jgi:taurine dioxygenase
MGSRFTLQRLTGTIGAGISGVDLNQPVDDETFAAIRTACLDHYVLLFRQQFLQPAAQVAFTRRWGDALVIPYLKPLQHADHPEIVTIPNMGKANSLTEQWHAESSFLPSPPAYTVLSAQRLPEYGGDTMFANQYLAYETLSPPLQHAIRDLRAIHRPTKPGVATGGNADAERRQVHPVIWTHPETERKALYVNRAYVHCFDGMTDDESRGLLDYLLDHSVRPDFTYRHRWSPGDVLVWDNRCTIHYAVHDYDRAERLMYRTITGDDSRPSTSH